MVNTYSSIHSQGHCVKHIKELRAFVRSVLSEGMMTGEWILENKPTMVITVYADESRISIIAWNREEWLDDSGAKRFVKQVGKISAEKPSATGECDGAWEVYWSHVNDKYSGLGPLLYDLAMELTGQDGLMSDRGSVSSDANKVWKFYNKKRPDVSRHQLDSPENELTPREEDNCGMDVAKKYSRSNDPKTWSKNPHAARFTKPAGKIAALEKMGIVKWVKNPEPSVPPM